MPKLPIETVIEMRAMFEPIMREQARAMIAAHALSGLLAGPVAKGLMKLGDAPETARNMADITMAKLYLPEGKA